MWEREQRYSAPSQSVQTRRLTPIAWFCRISAGRNCRGDPCANVIGKRLLTIDDLAILFVVRLAWVSDFWVTRCYLFQ